MRIKKVTARRLAAATALALMIAAAPSTVARAEGTTTAAPAAVGVAGVVDLSQFPDYGKAVNVPIARNGMGDYLATYVLTVPFGDTTEEFDLGFYYEDEGKGIPWVKLVGTRYNLDGTPYQNADEDIFSDGNIFNSGYYAFSRDFTVGQIYTMMETDPDLATEIVQFAFLDAQGTNIAVFITPLEDWRFTIHTGQYGTGIYTFSPVKLYA